MRKEAQHLWRRLVWLSTLIGVVLGSWGIGTAQAPLPPPGPVLHPPGSPPQVNAEKPSSQPQAPMIEQLTVPPFEKITPPEGQSPTNVGNRPSSVVPPSGPSISVQPTVPGTPVPPAPQGSSSAPIPVPATPKNPGPGQPTGQAAPRTPSEPGSPAFPSPPAQNTPTTPSPFPNVIGAPTPANPVSPPALLNPAVQAGEVQSKPASSSNSPPGSTGSAIPAPKVTPVPQQKPAPAILIIEVPPQATLWIEDQRMSQTGPVRSFQSPPLEPGKTYLYKIRLSWPGPNGQPITTEHEITVQAGQTQRIDFRPLAQSLGGSATTPTTITPLTPNPPPSNPPRRLFPFIRPEGSGSQ